MSRHTFRISWRTRWMNDSRAKLDKSDFIENINPVPRKINLSYITELSDKRLAFKIMIECYLQYFNFKYVANFKYIAN